MVCELPSHFADVRFVAAGCFGHMPSTNQTIFSKLREVPDNQEVWIDEDGFTSIIVDITERVGPSGSGAEIDGRAMTTHFEELVGSDIDSVKLWNTAETEFSQLE